MAFKRFLDIAVSSVCLVASLPLCLLAAIGIRLSSHGPVIYRAQRVGLGGKVFVMHKFRTMHTEQGTRPSAISGARDPRVFRFGTLLRRFKIDELPQLYDVLRGKMSLIGPRPEDPRIVREHYDETGHATLSVLPGLTSPGSLYYYTHGEQLLTGADPETFYVERLLPTKLALDLVYVRETSLMYDLRLLVRTAKTLIFVSLGRASFPDPPELEKSFRLCPAADDPRQGFTGKRVGT
jgi:lipopolysaccharide/colanic/teichoic acid biosynthesis glycosyltransferase